MAMSDAEQARQIMTLCQQGRFREAIVAAKAHVAEIVKSDGPEHPKVAFALQNIAGIHRELDQYGEAIDTCLRGIAILKQHSGHYKTLASLESNLGLLYNDQGQAANAEQHCKTAIAILEDHGDSDSEPLGAYLDNLALVLARQGRYRDAIEPCERALAIFKKRLRPGHPKVGVTANNLPDLKRRAR